MKRVYIAGKLNADAVGYVENMSKMIKASDEIRKMGFAVFVPCLDFICGLVIGGYKYEDYFDNNQEFLKTCDAVYLVPGWEESKGTQREISCAKHLGIPVYEKIEDLKR